MVEGRQVAGHLTWHGLEVDAENDGPLALTIRDMGIEVDQTYTIAEDTAMQVDPLTVDDPWARNCAKPIILRQYSDASSSWRSFIPVQYPQLFH